jgi:transcriptional regulator of heat shock response
MPDPFGPKLDSRARQLLRTLIAQYIADGQPGSTSVPRRSAT